MPEVVNLLVRREFIICFRGCRPYFGAVRELVAGLSVLGYFLTASAVAWAWYSARRQLPTVQEDIAAITRCEARLSETSDAPYSLLIDGNPDELAEFQAVVTKDRGERARARRARADILHRNGIAADDGPGVQLMTPRAALLMLRGAALASVVEDFKKQGAVALAGGLLSLVASVWGLYLPSNV